MFCKLMMCRFVRYINEWNRTNSLLSIVCYLASTVSVNIYLDNDRNFKELRKKAQINAYVQFERPIPSSSRLSSCI